MAERDNGTDRTSLARGAVAASGAQAEGSGRELLLGVLLSTIVFALHVVLEHRLRAMGAFYCLNTLFNADPGLTLEAISIGGGSNHLSHPLLEYLFSIPLGVIAKLASLLTSGGVDETVVRTSLGFVVVPAAAGLQTFVTLRLFRRLGLSLSSAILLAVLSSLSFSKIVLGSMPESYCLSALCISLGYVLFLRTRRRRGFRVELAWVALGVLTAGITITNTAVVALLYLAREWQLGRGLWSRFARTALMATVVLVVTLTGGYGLDRLFDAQPGRTPDEITWISRYLVDDPGVQFITFPTAVINGIVPPVPVRKPNNFALRAQKAAENAGRRAAGKRPAETTTPAQPAVPQPEAADGGDDATAKRPPTFLNQKQAAKPAPSDADASLPETTAEGKANAVSKPVPVPDGAASKGSASSDRIIPFSLTLQRTHVPRSLRNYAGFILLAALAWVALKDTRLDPTLRALALVSLAVLAFNWVLHGFWGGEQFLYSQHWHVSLFVLLGAGVSALEVRGRRALVPLLLCVAGVAASNWIVLTKMLDVLLHF